MGTLLLINVWNYMYSMKVSQLLVFYWDKVGAQKIFVSQSETMLPPIELMEIHAVRIAI